jgi:UDP-N-acetylglucosamine acyltransferase
VDRASIHRLRAAFRTLFMPAEGAPVFADRLAALRAEANDALLAEMLTFIDAPSRRGLIRHAVGKMDEDPED